MDVELHLYFRMPQGDTLGQTLTIAFIIFVMILFLAFVLFFKKKLFRQLLNLFKKLVKRFK